MKAIFIASILLTSSACALTPEQSLTARLGVQYATLELIDQSDAIGRQDVLAAVKLLRERSAGNPLITFDDMLAQVAVVVNWDSWSPQDKLLASALINRVEYGIDRIPSPEPSARLLTVLDWIEQAAML